MAKFIVTSGSTFNPFSYDELAKPIAQTVEAHNSTQDAYDTLASGAEALRQYILREPEDSEARRLYDSYMGRLENLQNNLWERGYNSGTRRDLSAARAGYQSNITRLATAVKDRSERSAAYWDAKHKNPNLVTSGDPGLDSLDDYLREENHGMNWFSYDSAQFEREVFAEMQARAKGILNGLTDENGVVRNPALKDQLTRVVNKGLMPDEVNAASALVDGLIDMTPQQRQAYYQEHGTSPVVSMMTESLISRYDATGIRSYKDIDDAEKAKLLNRGKAGLVGGIMEPEVKDFSDPEYEFDMWKRKEAIQHDHAMELAGLKKGDGNGSGKGKGGGTYTLESLASYVETADTKKLNQASYENFEKPYKDGPIDVKGLDGTPDQISSAYDAQRYLDEFGKSDIKRIYGVDADKPTGQFKTSAGTQIRVRYRQSTDPLDVTKKEYPELFPGEENIYGEYIYEYKDDKGNWKVDPETTKEFNRDINIYKDNVREFKKKNPNVDVQKLGLPEKDWDKMAKDFGISDKVPRYAYKAVINTLAKQGAITPAYLADTSSNQEGIRKSYTNSMIEAYSQAPKDRKGNVDKNSDVVVYKVDAKGKRTPERDMSELFGRDANKNIKNDVVTSIGVTPENVVDNEVTFTAKGNKYVANSRIFGNDVRSIIQAMRAPVYQTDGQNMSMLDDRGIVHYMMKPILDPVSVFEMTEQDKIDWISVVDEKLRNYTSLVATDGDGNVIAAVSPIDIVFDSAKQEVLRNAVTSYINDALSASRDTRNTQGFQPLSGTSSNPPTYYIPGQ